MLNLFRKDTLTPQTERIYKVPLCIQDTIPIYRIAENGIFELESPTNKDGGKKKLHQFDKMYLFEDINFSTQDEEEKEETGGGDPLFGAPLLFLICSTKEAVDYLMRYDAGIIAEHIHLKAAELGLGSVILFGFIRHLGENAEYIKKMNLPEGVYPLLGVAVGHGPGSAVKRKDDRHFKVLRME